ncbi:hypothetical protein UlMin_021991 [Ulmus minor]
MSSSEIIEHVVLFKLKHNTDPSDSTSMITKLNALISLDEVLHLTAGPLLRVRSTSHNFTHILHSRYTSKSDLVAYAVHPRHQSAVKENANLVDDIMAVDWISNDLPGPVSLPPGSAMRVSLLKLKEDLGEEAKSEILERIRGIREESEGLSQYSFGENFSPERAKGFSMAFLEVFSSQKEMEAVDLKHEDKFKDYLDSFVELSYEVSS